MEDKYKAGIAGIGIICVTGLAGYALSLGIDSAMLASVVSFVGMVIGYCFGRIKK